MDELLNGFYTRIHNIAPQVLLHKSIERKETLSTTYGFEGFDEKVNIVYMLLVYILQQSLRDEECTLRDMAEFLESVNIEYFDKDIKAEDYVKLANCIVNEVILNDGNTTTFKCLDTETREYKKVYVQLIDHERSSENNSVTYKLTEMGYNLVLSTLEMESNMKLEFHTFLLKESLKARNFDKALVDIKNIFALSKRQIKALQEGIVRAREDITKFTTEEYTRIINGSIEVAEKQVDKFKGYEHEIELIEQELIEQDIQFRNLNDQDQSELDDIKEKLAKLDLIKKEITKVIFEHANMFTKHFEFKSEYENAIDNSIAYFKRDKINIKDELSDLVVKDLTQLDFISFLLSPLFSKSLHKEYDIKSVFTPQKSKIAERDSSTKIALKVDKEELLMQKQLQEQQNKEKLKQYENILEIILKFGVEIKQEFLLSDFIDAISDTEDFRTLTLNMYQLREVLIELLDSSVININELKRESRMLRSGYDNSGDFQPLRAILETIKNNSSLKKINEFSVSKMKNAEKVNITMDCMQLTVDNIEFNFILNN